MVITLGHCASLPVQEIIWYHNGHEEIIVRDHQPYTPQGKLLHWGDEMECWLTHKPMGMEDLTQEGRRVRTD